MTNAQKLSPQQAAWLARQRKGSVGKPALVPDGRMSVRVNGIVYIVGRDGQPTKL